MDNFKTQHRQMLKPPRPPPIPQKTPPKEDGDAALKHSTPLKRPTPLKLDFAKKFAQASQQIIANESSTLLKITIPSEVSNSHDVPLEIQDEEKPKFEFHPFREPSSSSNAALFRPNPQLAPSVQEKTLIPMRSSSPESFEIPSSPEATLPNPTQEVALREPTIPEEGCRSPKVDTKQQQLPRESSKMVPYHNDGSAINELDQAVPLHRRTVIIISNLILELTKCHQVLLDLDNKMMQLEQEMPNTMRMLDEKLGKSCFCVYSLVTLHNLKLDLMLEIG